MDWLKKNKKFIASVVIIVLQALGVIPNVDSATKSVSDVTNPVGE